MNYAQPATEQLSPQDVSRLLTDLWSELLDVDVEPEDDFFELGGYSLLIVDLVARARKVGVQMQARDVYEYRTVARIAEAVTGAPITPNSRISGNEAFAEIWRAGANPRRPGAAETLVRVRPEGDCEPVFVVHWGVGNVEFLSGLGTRFAEGRPVYGLESPGVRAQVRPLLSIGEMAEHYLEQITRIQPNGPYHLCGVCQGGLIALEIARMLREAGHDVPVLAVLNLPDLEPFIDPAWGPGEILDFRLESLRGEYGIDDPEHDLVKALPAFAELGWYLTMTPTDYLRQQAVWAANTFAQLHYHPRPYAGPVLMAQLTAWDPAIRRRWDELLPARHVVTVEGTEHTLPVLRSTEFLDAFNKLLADARARR